MKNVFFNKALRILLITNGMILFAGAMLGPIYALFVEQIGGDLMDASIAGALFMFVAGIVSLVSGRYSDSVKENELIIVLGYVLMGTGFLLYMIADSVLFVFAIQVLIGMGEAIYSPAFDAQYSKHIDGHKSGKQWGAWEAMSYFVGAIGAIIGGVVVTMFSFQLMFAVMAVLCFVSASYIYVLPRKVL